MTKNRWRSVDAHIHDGAGRVLLSVIPIKAAKNSVVTDYNLSEVWLPRTYDHKSLTLRWCSFAWWGREGIAICFAYKGGQELLCDWLQRIGGVISQDAWPKIVYALLTLILPWSIHNMQSFILAQSIIHFVLAAFLAFSFTFFLITTLFFNNTYIYMIIIFKIPCLSVNARHQLQDHSIRCFCLQNES
jgi:hypothetical protein